MVAIEYPVTKRFVGGMRAETLICQDTVVPGVGGKNGAGEHGASIAGTEGFVYLYRHVDSYFCGLLRNIWPLCGGALCTLIRRWVPWLPCDRDMRRKAPAIDACEGYFCQ